MPATIEGDSLTIRHKGGIHGKDDTKRRRRGAPAAIRCVLFGDLAGVTFFNHSAESLATLLRRNDLHPRLVNGSDYPLPAINFLVMTGRLVRHGFVTSRERKALNEIYRYNPLLFDFVLKRTLRDPKTGRRFPPSVFMLPETFPAPP